METTKPHYEMPKQLSAFNTPVFTPKPYPVNFLRDFLNRTIYDGDYIMLRDPSNPTKSLIEPVHYYADGAFIINIPLTSEMTAKSTKVKPKKK